MFFKNPLYDWKNLITNPNIVIRRDIAKVASSLPELKSTVEKIKEHGKSLGKAVTQIASLDIKIKDKEQELRKAKDDKTKARLDREVKSLLKKKEHITNKNKGVEADFVKKAADSFVEFDDMIETLCSLNIQPLTLIHRARRDIDDLIDKVKALKHENVVQLEQMKAGCIALLNQQKEHLKDTADMLYRSSEFQERKQFNPAELTNEMSFSGTPLKCRRIRNITVEIDHLEARIENMSRNLRIQELPQFVKAELSSQIDDFHKLSHHIKILTHRLQRTLESFPQNKRLMKKLHKRLRDITRQTRLLWNSIEIKGYKPKITAEYRKQANVLRFRQKPKEELKEMKKAA